MIGRFSPQEVQQGSGGTCSILATLASAAESGQGLRGNISYLGNNAYRVKLYESWLFGTFHHTVYALATGLAYELLSSRNGSAH